MIDKLNKFLCRLFGHIFKITESPLPASDIKEWAHCLECKRCDFKQEFRGLINPAWVMERFSKGLDINS